MNHPRQDANIHLEMTAGHTKRRADGHMGVSIVMGDPQNGWFLLGEIHLEMDDLGGSPTGFVFLDGLNPWKSHLEMDEN